MAEAVVVGVRVRPFNQREKNLNAKLCIDMQGSTTIINDQQGMPLNFTFDQSFWSHDDFEEDETGHLNPVPGGRYSDQQQVFETMGQRVLDNAWAGYHCCLFAYGQTGAGKSYSMVGYDNNKGIVPISCEEIFRRINTNTKPDIHYEVLLSMVEIYNETVQDLFIPVDERPKAGYQIRESKALGIYVDGIIKNAVDSYEAIESAIDRGTANRSVGATQMNATSSRAHTVITIEFKQVEKMRGTEAVKVSNINLVDLAGSEKANQSGAKGDRLKEGSAINKSLSALGNVIEKLAERSSNPKKGKDIVIPYRDSKLTRLLSCALGGSSKTIMICALSPASSNYEETLSTLRYADRAKKIKNMVVINENPQEKLMREMREENAKLKAMIEAGGGSGTLSPHSGGGGGLDPAAVEAQKEQIAQLEKALQEQQQSFQDRVKETRVREEAYIKRGSTKMLKTNIDRSDPLMINLNPELQLCGKIRYEINENPEDRPMVIGGNSAIDSQESDDDSEDEAEILLGCDGVSTKHATIKNVDRRCFLNADGTGAGQTWVNGVSIAALKTGQYARNEEGLFEKLAVKQGEEPPVRADTDHLEGDPPGILLKHCDRLTFGKGIFLFVDPREGFAEVLIMAGQYTFAKARKELPEEWKKGAAGKQASAVFQSAVKKLREMGNLQTDRAESGNEDNAESGGAAGNAKSALAKPKGDLGPGKMLSFEAPGSEESSEPETEQLQKQLKDKDSELEKLRSELAARDAEMQKAKEEQEAAAAEAKARQEADRRAIAAAERAQEEAERSSQAAKHQAAAAARQDDIAKAKLRLDETVVRAREAVRLADVLRVDGAQVETVKSKLESLEQTVKATDKLQKAVQAADATPVELRIAIQQAKKSRMRPVDGTLIGRAEEKLEKLCAA